MKQVEVVFSGKSLYLCMLAASLQQKEEFRICMLDHEPAIPELRMLCPDALISDAATDNEMIASLCRELRLITAIVYPSTDTVEISWDDQHFISSADSMVQIILEVMEKRLVGKQ